MQSRIEVQQKMFDLIEQWKTSGLSQKAFCQQHQVRYSVFHYWYKQYRVAHPQDNLDNNPTHNASSFIPLQLNSCFPTASHTELIYPDGRRLVFHQQVDAHFLKALIG
jgi:hypothetical protein